jgi:hypothetical protein
MQHTRYVLKRICSSNDATVTAQTSALKGASNEQINGLYQGYSAAIAGALAIGGDPQASPWSVKAGDYTLAAGSLVPLSRLHGDAIITGGNASSYQFWKGKSTEEIIESLKPGSRFGELTVKPSGVVMNGNTRIKVLEERGVDVNAIERVIRNVEPIE